MKPHIYTKRKCEATSRLRRKPVIREHCSLFCQLIETLKYIYTHIRDAAYRIIFIRSTIFRRLRYFTSQESYNPCEIALYVVIAAKSEIRHCGDTSGEVNFCSESIK